MNIIRIPTGPISTNTYIVYPDGAEGEIRPCVVIDPAASRKVLEVLEKNRLRLEAILLTHGHFDHTLGVAALKEKTGAEVMIHEADRDALTGGEGSLAYMGGMFVEKCGVDRVLHDGDRISAAGFDFDVIHTPGHTPGGVCYVVESEKVIFSGDTLFYMSVGRTDLPGGDGEQLYESIAYRLLPLHGDYRVLPGHMTETTLDFERQHNPFIKNPGMY